MKLYGSDKCPHCPPAKKYLEEKNIPFEWVNITDSMKNLKEFLALREREEFDNVREKGNVGIPVVLTEENEVIFEIEEKF